MKYRQIYEILLVFIVPYLILGLLSLPLGYLIKLLLGINLIKGCLLSISGLYLLCAVWMGYMLFDKTIEN